MSEGLEALKRVKNDKKYERRIDNDDLNIIEKELKALEIIKIFSFYDEYFLDYLLGESKISKEEYDLLKEVLL